MYKRQPLRSFHFLRSRITIPYELPDPAIKLKPVNRNILSVSYTHLTLPTSDPSVDLGGRRIIKKKTSVDHGGRRIIKKKLNIEVTRARRVAGQPKNEYHRRTKI